MKLVKESLENKKFYTREEVIRLLEILYCEVAEDYNDYGKYASDYEKIAEKDVEKFMENK